MPSSSSRLQRFATSTAVGRAPAECRRRARPFPPATSGIARARSAGADADRRAYSDLRAMHTRALRARSKVARALRKLHRVRRDHRQCRSSVGDASCAGCSIAPSASALPVGAATRRRTAREGANAQRARATQRHRLRRPAEQRDPDFAVMRARERDQPFGAVLRRTSSPRRARRGRLWSRSPRYARDSRRTTVLR